MYLKVTEDTSRRIFIPVENVSYVPLKKILQLQIPM